MTISAQSASRLRKLSTPLDPLSAKNAELLFEAFFRPSLCRGHGGCFDRLLPDSPGGCSAQYTMEHVDSNTYEFPQYAEQSHMQYNGVAGLTGTAEAGSFQCVQFITSQVELPVDGIEFSYFANKMEAIHQQNPCKMLLSRKRSDFTSERSC